MLFLADLMCRLNTMSKEESIKAEVLAVLTSLSNEDALLIVQVLLDDVGVETVDDLRYVEPSDLNMLKPIQVRKLIAAWNSEGKL